MRWLCPACRAVQMLVRPPILRKLEAMPPRSQGLVDLGVGFWGGHGTVEREDHVHEHVRPRSVINARTELE